MIPFVRTLTAAALMLSPASSLATDEVAAQTAGEAAPQFGDLLQVYNDRWMALHLFAYHSAVDASTKRVRGRFDKHPEDAALLRGELADAFAPLAAAYEPYIGMHPLFDDKLALIGVHILQNGIETLPDENLRAALIDFMPVYEQYFAERHQAAVDAMSASILVGVDRHGAIVGSRLADILGGEWGDDPIRFDIVPYASRAGAFTAGSWRWTAMGAMDETNRAHALELVFHEASHMKPIGEAIQPAAEAALERHGLENDRFWRFLLWYASGEAVKAALGEDYVTYSEAVGLRDNPDGKIWYDALDATWDKHENLRDRADAAVAWVAARQ